MEVVEKISSRIILINNGEIVVDGSFKDLKSSSMDGSLEEIFNQLTGFNEHEKIAKDIVSTIEEVM